MIYCEPVGAILIQTTVLDTSTVLPCQALVKCLPSHNFGWGTGLGTVVEVVCTVGLDIRIKEPFFKALNGPGQKPLIY